MKLALSFGLIVTLVALAGEPPQNTIPTIGIRIGRNLFPELEDVALEHVILLSWRYLDGIDSWGWAAVASTDSVASWCDSIGALFVFSPAEMGSFAEPSEPNGLWFRWDSFPDVTSQYAFAKPDPDGWDNVYAFMDGPTFYDSLPLPFMQSLHDSTSSYPAYWFFSPWDEGNTNQRARMVTADTSEDFGEFYGYWPDMYTQARSEVDSTPTMEEIDPEGVFSWLKWAYEHTEGAIPVTTTLGTLLTYNHERYPGLGESDLSYGTLADMGRCVRAIRDMECSLPNAQADSANAPEFICFNRYPFRQVDMDIETEMGDTCWIYMIDLAEESMDTVVSNAGEMPVFFYTQVFGGFGGPAMRDDHNSLDYFSLMYRQPSVAEFRMLCNLALMHQMKGIFPYDIRSYHELPGNDSLDWVACSLLDWNLIPFDAPYEEWVYSGRLEHDVCSPESIPPFNGYDPLFEIDEAPVISGERGLQNYYTWKFTPFANLWNGMRDILGEVKTIGPEIGDLWWLDGTGHPDLVQFVWEESCWVGPECRIFTNDDEDYYLYYVNRCCADSAHVFSFGFDYDSLPDATIYALDHTRRIILQSGDSREDRFDLTDTLEAGQGRLLELLPNGATNADLRLTEHDVWAEGPSGITRDFRFTAGDVVTIYAEAFNMGNASRDDIAVTLYDISEDSTLIDSDTADLPGLSRTSHEPATDTLSFTWETDSTDIGAHVLEIRAASWQGEPDGDDNWVRAAFLIDPRDYSTDVLNTPWDMREATSGIPDWKTNDVDSLLRWDTTAWTDSIGGMFEGEIAPGYFSVNRMYLHMPTSSGLWIDGNLYNRLSLTAKCSPASELIVGWVDSHNTESSSLVDTIGTTWGETGPIDLSTLWSGETIKKVWLRFDPIGTSMVNARVRIGRVWLEEAKP